MRARCVDNKGLEESFTVGKVYEIGLGRFVVCNEVDISGACGQYESSRFELIPDVPDAPKSEWMQTSDVEFVNMKLDMYIYFEIVSDVHFCRLSHMNSKKDFEIHGEFADAFASLVGYEWPSAGKEV